MIRGFKMLFSISAALPVLESERAVFNYTANAETGHFLGLLFRVLGEVLGTGKKSEDESSTPVQRRPSERKKSKKNRKLKKKEGLKGETDPTVMLPMNPPSVSVKASRIPPPNTLWECSENVLHDLTQVFLRYLPTDRIENSKESQRIIVSIQELMYAKDSKSTAKWTCSLAYLLLLLRNKLLVQTTKPPRIRDNDAFNETC